VKRVAVVLALVLAGCAGGLSSSVAPSAAAPITISVFAAASLKDALEAAMDVYLATIKINPGAPELTFTISTDSSAALRTQIEHGALADLFLSADTTNPEMLVDADLTDGDLVVFAENELAIIVPADNPSAIESPADLARPGVKIIAAGEEVPISRYAGELLEHLAGLPGYPPDLAGAYAANIVSREENVRAVVTKVELGEGDAGIVYATDASAAGSKIATIEIPAAAQVRASYAGVVIKGSNLTRSAGRGFLNWLAGPGGQRVLGSFGFLPPSA
jgi:molybdate transport system substrate-binding protein